MSFQQYYQLVCYQWQEQFVSVIDGILAGILQVTTVQALKYSLESEIAHIVDLISAAEEPTGNICV